MDYDEAAYYEFKGHWEAFFSALEKVGNNPNRSAEENDAFVNAAVDWAEKLG